LPNEDTPARSGRPGSGDQRSGGDQRQRLSGLMKSGSKSYQRGGLEAQPTMRHVKAGPGGEGTGSDGYQARGEPPGQSRAPKHAITCNPTTTTYNTMRRAPGVTPGMPRSFLRGGCNGSGATELGSDDDD
jgi:hypothetical protein